MKGGTISLVAGDQRQLPKAMIGELRPGLVLLLQALDCAVITGRDPWRFAVEIHHLRSLGLTEIHLRLLVCMRYVEHAGEVTRREDAGREFRHTGDLLFVKRTCFILTPLGAAFVRSLAEIPASTNGVIVAARPAWSKLTRTLTFGGETIRQYRWPATNQELILNVFEEEGWPQRIDDPLPPQGDLERKQRLRDAIRALNAHHERRVIRFFGDGTADGVSWKLVSDNV